MKRAMRRPANTISSTVPRSFSINGSGRAEYAVAANPVLTLLHGISIHQIHRPAKHLGRLERPGYPC
jgi:hypothetical protein